jgi:hypothetical protein
LSIVNMIITDWAANLGTTRFPVAFSLACGILAAGKAIALYPPGHYVGSPAK